VAVGNKGEAVASWEAPEELDEINEKPDPSELGAESDPSKDPPETCILLNIDSSLGAAVLSVWSPTMSSDALP